jgi:hypothetical protein
MFIIEKSIVLTLVDFPDPEQAHQSLVIENFFTTFDSVYSSCTLLIPMARRWSVISVIVWPLYLLAFC